MSDTEPTPEGKWLIGQTGYIVKDEMMDKKLIVKIILFATFPIWILPAIVVWYMWAVVSELVDEVLGEYRR